MRLRATHRIDLRAPATIRLALVPAALAAAAVALELQTPVHVEAPAASAGIETAIASSALVAVCLLAARFRHRRLLRDLLLLGAVAALAITDLAFSAAPALIGSDRAVPGTSAQLVMQALVAISFVAAAFAPGVKVADRVHRRVAAAGIAAIGIALLAGVLEIVVGPGLVGSTVRGSQVAAASLDPVAIVISSSAMLIAAGTAFVSRGRRGDHNASLLGGASFLLAAAGLQTVALPMVAADWITPNGGLRLVACGMLLLAALRTYAETRDDIAREALTAERQRIARDLHDGLVQDLALISLHAQHLQSEPGTEHPLAIAARHAIAVSRGTLSDLSASQAPTTSAALHQVARELAERFGVHVRVDVRPEGSRTHSADCDAVQREQVVRIAREAIVNAVRHGGARRIEVTLENPGSTLRLSVSDDGCGISEQAPQWGHGFGVPTMLARAQSLGGRVSTRRRAHGGTEVELLVP